MGGSGSGRPRLSDDEKIERGTFNPSRSDAVAAAKAAEKVVVGPWLKDIPDPSVPLNEVGKAKYEQFAKLLLNSNKLTPVTCGDCERYAVMHQRVHQLLSEGKPVPQQILNAMNSLSVRLRIAEDAPAIANPNQKNRFAGAGFANNRSSPISLRPHTAAGTGQL